MELYSNVYVNDWQETNWTDLFFLVLKDKANYTGRFNQVVKKKKTCRYIFRLLICLSARLNNSKLWTDFNYRFQKMLIQILVYWRV